MNDAAVEEPDHLDETALSRTRIRAPFGGARCRSGGVKTTSGCLCREIAAMRAERGCRKSPDGLGLYSARWPRSALMSACAGAPAGRAVKEHRLRLLGLRLNRHEVHGRSLRRFRDRLRVGRVVLASLDERLHVDRGNQPHLVAERRDLPAPVMGAGASLHRRRTPRLRGEKPQQPPAAQLPAEGHRPVRSRPVQLKAALCQINPDDANLFHVDVSSL